MDYHQKYLKYKNRYMQLKQLKNNNNLEGGAYGYYSTNMFFGIISLKDVPESERTESLCMTAVKKDPLELKYVPDKNRNREMCMIAVKEQARMLYYVPRKHKDYAMCYAAIVESKNRYSDSLEEVPEDNMTSDQYDFLVKKALEYDGAALKYVPENKKTDELCKIAVKDNGLALKYVPENKKTDELCKIAVKNDISAIKYVPETMKNDLIAEYKITEDSLDKNHGNKYYRGAPISYHRAPPISSNKKTTFTKR
jgi:hypothetical protein